jgi:hypothetical protein
MTEKNRTLKNGTEKIKKGKTLQWGLPLLVFLVLITPSCEQIFTYSPLSFAQRDPANLSEAQQIAYAQSILGTGASREDLIAAYEAIADSSDPEVQYLASQVAVAASGINEAAETILESIDTIDQATIESILGTIDDKMLTNAVDSMDIADADSATRENISSEDYLITAAAILLSNDLALNDTTFTHIDTFMSGTPTNNDADPEEKAAYYLVEAGYTAEDLDSLLNFGS